MPINYFSCAIPRLLTGITGKVIDRLSYIFVVHITPGYRDVITNF